MSESESANRIDTGCLAAARDALLKLAGGCAEVEDAADMNRRVAWLDERLGSAACRSLDVYPLGEHFRLSVIVPVYNEAATVEQVIARVRSCGLPCEIIVVDDGSTDDTPRVLDRMAAETDVRLLRHDANLGKGAALKTGMARCRGDAVVVQDADLEYDPRELARLLRPIVEDRADVVYGTRFPKGSRRVSPLGHRTANRLITRLSNLATGLSLSDVETCYKVMRRTVVDRIAPTLVERGFGVEIELTAKLAQARDLRIEERPISYAARWYGQGKKITWRDGLWAVRCIVRYR